MQGLWPNYIKVVPSIALAFTTYELLKEMMGALQTLVAFGRSRNCSLQHASGTPCVSRRPRACEPISMVAQHHT